MHQQHIDLSAKNEGTKQVWDDLRVENVNRLATSTNTVSHDKYFRSTHALAVIPTFIDIHSL